MAQNALMACCCWRGCPAPGDCMRWLLLNRSGAGAADVVVVVVVVGGGAQAAARIVTHRNKYI